jgi:hypothetical protein
MSKRPRHDWFVKPITIPNWTASIQPFTAAPPFDVSLIVSEAIPLIPPVDLLLWLIILAGS